MKKQISKLKIVILIFVFVISSVGMMIPSVIQASGICTYCYNNTPPTINSFTVNPYPNVVSQFSVSASASASTGIDTLRIYVDGSVVAQNSGTTSISTTYYVPSSWASGSSHTVKFVATAYNGYSSSAQKTVYENKVTISGTITTPSGSLATGSQTVNIYKVNPDYSTTEIGWTTANSGTYSITLTAMQSYTNYYMVKVVPTITDTYTSTSSAYVQVSDQQGSYTAPTMVINQAAPTITSLSNNQIVNGLVTLSVSKYTYSQSVVGEVDYLLDGTANVIGYGSTTSPYSFTWNTSTVSNGIHTLYARVWNTAFSNYILSPALTVDVEQVVLTTETFNDISNNLIAPPAILSVASMNGFIAPTLTASNGIDNLFQTCPDTTGTTTVCNTATDTLSNSASLMTTLSGDYSQFPAWQYDSVFSNGQITTSFYPDGSSNLIGIVGIRTIGCASYMSSNCNGYALEIHQDKINLYRIDNGTNTSLYSITMPSSIASGSNNWYTLTLKADNYMIDGWVKNLVSGDFYHLSYNTNNDKNIYTQGRAFYGVRPANNAETYIDNVQILESDNPTGSRSSSDTLPFSSTANYGHILHDAGFNATSPGWNIQGTSAITTAFNSLDHRYTPNDPSNKSLSITADSGVVKVYQTITDLSSYFYYNSYLPTLFSVYFKNENPSDGQVIGRLGIIYCTASCNEIDGSWENAAASSWAQLTLQIPSLSASTGSIQFVITIENKDTSSPLSVRLDSASVVYYHENSYIVYVPNTTKLAGLVNVIEQITSVSNGVATIGVTLGYEGINNYKLASLDLNLGGTGSSGVTMLGTSESNNAGYQDGQGYGFGADFVATFVNHAIAMIQTYLLIDGFIFDSSIDALRSVYGLTLGNVFQYLANKYASNTPLPGIVSVCKDGIPQNKLDFSFCLIEHAFEISSTSSTWNYNLDYGSSYVPDYISLMSNEAFFNWDFSSGQSLTINPIFSFGVPQVSVSKTPTLKLNSIFQWQLSSFTLSPS